MNHALQLRLARTRGCAVQAIWLVERHGFHIQRMTLEADDLGPRLNLEIASASQSLAELTHALNELPDVREVGHNRDTTPQHYFEAVAS